MRHATILLLLAMPVLAGWEFSPAIDVGRVEGKRIYHHLESANRRGVAESSGRVGLVWEDDRAGEPRCWLAVREIDANGFASPQAVSKGECYEPVLQGLGDGRFVTAWEETGAVWVKDAERGDALRLSSEEAAHATLARLDARTVYAAWAELAGGKYKRIMLARLSLGVGGLKHEYSVPLEEQLPADDQAYPGLAVGADGSVTAVWEDRRKKHTMLLAAHSTGGRKFAAPYRLIDMPQLRTIDLGAGMGSMRPTLSTCGPDCMVAAWLDKRDFLSGYDVYAAFSRNGGNSFTRNLKVQDSFGDSVAQWHAAIVANQAGKVVAVWDDDRDGAPDVWLSDWNGNGFGDNLAVPGASGPGAQSNPVAHLDDRGILHLAWLEETESGGTRLKYANAVWKD
jgi:hypothetical protein